jgi:Protein of unknown function (DUF1580)
MSVLTARSPETNNSVPKGLLPIAKAAGPRFGYPHKATVIRWIIRGVKTPDGRRVRLRAWRFGSRWMTTAEAVEEFSQVVLVPSEPAAPPRTMSARQRASEQAEAELRAMGM